MIEVLSAAESAAVVADVGRFIPDLQRWATSSTQVQRKLLSCYRDYAFVRISDSDASHRPLEGLYAPGDFWPLDSVGVEMVNKLSPLHLTRETAGDYALLVFGWSSDDLTREVLDAPDGAYLVKQSDERRLLIPANGHLSISRARVPRVDAILGVKQWTIVPSGSEDELSIFKQIKFDSSLHDDMEFSLRRADLPFYRDHGLFELLSRRKTGVTFQQYYFLWHPNWTAVRPLYGESQPIHQTNSDELPLLSTKVAVAEYLRFFCWATRADDGRFLIVERFRDVPLAKAPDERDRQILLRYVKPIVVNAAVARGETDGAWDCSATIVYGRHVFNASFVVSTDGRVEMADDDPLDRVLPIAPFEPAMLTDDRSLAGGGDPKTYLDRLVRSSQQSADRLVDCTPEQLLAEIDKYDG